MTFTLSDRSSVIVAFGLILLIIATSICLAFSSLLSIYPELAVGVTYDLALTAPLFYLFFIRKTKIPKTSAVPLFVGGLILASYLIPAENQFHLSIIKSWILPVVEISVLAYIGIKTYKIYTSYKLAKNKNSDILKILNEACESLFGIPVLAKVAAFEFAVIYYAFVSWKKPIQNEFTFSYHKASGKIALYMAIIFILSIETLVLHILVARWNVILAWILTVTSVYLLIQIFAHSKAVYQRPIEIIGEKLFIRYGLFGGAIIHLSNIEKIEFSTSKNEDNKDVKQVSLVGDLEQFNTHIYLKKQEIFCGFYGSKCKFKTLLLFIDDKEKFKQIIERR